jgi:glucose-6-phosphate-specific signal transduction histidine kinase
MLLSPCCFLLLHYGILAAYTPISAEPLETYVFLRLTFLIHSDLLTVGFHLS